MPTHTHVNTLQHTHTHTHTQTHFPHSHCTRTHALAHTHAHTHTFKQTHQNTLARHNQTTHTTSTHTQDIQTRICALHTDTTCLRHVCTHTHPHAHTAHITRTRAFTVTHTHTHSLTLTCTHTHTLTHTRHSCPALPCGTGSADCAHACTHKHTHTTVMWKSWLFPHELSSLRQGTEYPVKQLQWSCTKLKLCTRPAPLPTIKAVYMTTLQSSLALECVMNLAQFTLEFLYTEAVQLSSPSLLPTMVLQAAVSVRRGPTGATRTQHYTHLTHTVSHTTHTHSPCGTESADCTSHKRVHTHARTHTHTHTLHLVDREAHTAHDSVERLGLRRLERRAQPEDRQVEHGRPVRAATHQRASSERMCSAKRRDDDVITAEMMTSPQLGQ